MSKNTDGGVRRKRRRTTWFGKILASAINVKGITLTECAGQIGVTPGAVSRWRSGEEVPVDKKYIKALSEIFDIEFESLCVIVFSSKYPFLRRMFRKEPVVW